MRRFFLCTVCFLVLSLFASGQDDGFVSLMTVKDGDTWTDNGKPLNGWVKYGGEAGFSVENGEIVGKRGEGDNTFLCTQKSYSNFVFKAEFKYDILCNSGVQFRSAVRDENGGKKVFGYQYEIDESASAFGVVYDESRRNRWLETITKPQKEAMAAAYKKGEWNLLTIQCVGPVIKTYINGVKIADQMDLETDAGFFGLQIHAGGQGQVRWKNVRIKELPETKWVAIYANKKLSDDLDIKPVGKWEVQDDGSLRGTTPDGEPRDGIIVTKTSYKDFAVKVDFKEVAGNSGLYFRASAVDKPYWLKGFQCEIAPDGKVCAGLWEVEGRGWVKRNDEVAQKVFKGKDWNTISTVAIGDRLVTHLNGQTIVDIIDPKCAKEGSTGLQLHGGGNQGCLFREYWIMPLDGADIGDIK
ncbi:MAG: DUF1080 domain-containing protein [Planctomycetaceae bacterium]|nr:DUF1080 domain-containing protein [Planctomycetaceae bacterium]